MSTSLARLDWLDALKGIAIVLVVMGHNPWLLTSYPDQAQALALFHMPLFVMVSGYFLTASLVSLKRRFRAVVIPYFVTGLLFLSWDVLRPNGNTLQYAISSLLAGGALPLWQAHLWFLPALFSAILLFVLCMKLLGAEPKAYAKLGVAALLFLIGFLVSGKVGMAFVTSHGNDIWVLPWGLDLAPNMTALMLIGSVVRKSFGERLNQIHTLWLACLAIVVSLGIVETCQHLGVRLDMNERIFTTEIWIVPALSGVVLCYFVQDLMKRIPVLHGWLCYTGKASLVIYLFHYWLQFFMAKKLDAHGFSAGWAIALVLVACLMLDRLIRGNAHLRKIYYP